MLRQQLEQLMEMRCDIHRPPEGKRLQTVALKQWLRIRTNINRNKLRCTFKKEPPPLEALAVLFQLRGNTDIIPTIPCCLTHHSTALYGDRTWSPKLWASVPPLMETQLPPPLYHNYSSHVGNQHTLANPSPRHTSTQGIQAHRQRCHPPRPPLPPPNLTGKCTVSCQRRTTVMMEGCECAQRMNGCGNEWRGW